jgi:hypothetical protein
MTNMSWFGGDSKKASPLSSWGSTLGGMMNSVMELAPSGAGFLGDMLGGLAGDPVTATKNGGSDPRSFMSELGGGHDERSIMDELRSNEIAQRYSGGGGDNVLGEIDAL